MLAFAVASDPADRVAHVRLVAASIAAFSAAPGAAGCGGTDTKVSHPVVTYTGATPAAGGSTIQEDFPCHDP
jgi:hypothetical protein